MALRSDQQRLVREIQLLQRCEEGFGLLAKPVVDQLVMDSDRQLPDVLPECPRWIEFTWPEGEGVDYTAYWRQVDRNETKWLGPYL